MKKQLQLLFISACISLGLSAQTPGGGLPGKLPAGISLNIARAYGKVLADDNKEALSYASVALMPMDNDAAIAGVLTKENGDFALENLPFGQYRLKITYLGYQSVEKTIAISPTTADQDLGNFRLQPEGQLLKETVIYAEKDRVQIGIDRKVFNVEKDIAAQNGTAVDALKNVPTLSIDNDGKVQLRGGAPQIFVDGKPTNLSLNQIPAAEIERVEVISNASAKYDANATGGIINLVMKKNSKPGISGMTNLGIGTNNRYNAMTNLNLKQGPINLSLSYNINQARNITEGFTDRTSFGSDGLVSGYYRQDNTNTMKNRFQFGRAALDYSLNNRNTLTLSETVVAGNFELNDPQVFSFKDGSGQLLSTGTRSTLGMNQFRFYNTELGWRRTYPTAGKEWVVSSQFGVNKGENKNDLENRLFAPDGTELVADPARQLNDGGSSGHTAILQTDFTQPFANGVKLEIGAKSQWKRSENDLDAQLYNAETQTWTRSDYLSTNYHYDDLVNAAYANLSGKINKSWRYQAGLRFEQSWFRGTEVGTDSSFSYQYPSSVGDLGKALFPSVYLSKTLTKTSEMQVNFSRKLNRPNFFQIMPFVMVIDNQSYRSGNPNLQPEFVNTAEWNYSNTFNRGSWLVSAYGKYTEQPIAELTSPAGDGSTALLTTFINGSSSTGAGFENTLKLKLLKGLNATANVNTFYQKIETETVGNEGWNWMGKLNFDYNFAKNWTAQLSGQYESPRIIPQGEMREQYFADFALRYNLGIMGSVSLSVSDIFDTKRMGSQTETAYFSQDLARRRESRYVQLGVMLRFGKPDFSLLKKQRKPGDGGVQGGGGDYGY
jgi:iron complex outermembrane receptor protein